MDYEGEQAMEMEALEAILMDDLLPYEGTLPDGADKRGRRCRSFRRRCAAARPAAIARHAPTCTVRSAVDCSSGHCRGRGSAARSTQAPAHPSRTGRRPASSPPGEAGWTTHAKPFKIVIHPLEDGEDPEDDDDVPMMDFVFAHTPRYPDEPPCVRLKSARGLSDADIAAATAVVEAEAAANLGMAMVFTLVQARERERGALCAPGGRGSGPQRFSPRCADAALPWRAGARCTWLAGIDVSSSTRPHPPPTPGAQAAKEWLRTAAEGEATVDPVEARRKAEAEDEVRRAAARALGTMVSVEAFNAWKHRYAAECALARAALAGGGDGGRDDKAARLTGKQYFLRQYAAGGEDALEAAEAAAAAAAGDDEFAGADDDGEGDFDDEDDEDDDEDFDPDEDDDSDEEDEELLEAMLRAKS
jgi:hypothetical protein